MRMVREIADNLFIDLARELRGKVIVRTTNFERLDRESPWHFVGLRTYQMIPTHLWQQDILEELENETGQH